MTSKREVKRNNTGIGQLYKPVLLANIKSNNTDFYIPIGAYTDSAMQSAVSAYLNDIHGEGVWKTSIVDLPGQLHVYKAPT
jgi:hypothetical protein